MRPIRVADLVIDAAGQRASRAGTPLALTAIELRLLTVLAGNAGRALSRAELAKRVWRRAPTVGSNLVDVAIWRLRLKLDEPFARKLIHSARGVGYRFAADA